MINNILNHDTKANRTVYVVGSGIGYANWCQAKPVYHMEEASFVLFTGGSDISPYLYNKRAHPSTYPNPERDHEEVSEFKTARELGKPMLGICRGAQLLCAMAGGILVQDQHHSYMHDIETEDGRKIVVNSMHHQCAYPWNMPKDDYRVIAWANNLSSQHKGESDEDELINPDGKEAEIVFYPKINALGMQHHPEGMFGHYDSKVAIESISYMRGLLDRLLNKSL